MMRKAIHMPTGRELQIPVKKAIREKGAVNNEKE